MAALLILIAARLALYLVSPPDPRAAGPWRADAICGAPLCTVSPDSSRYAKLTDYFVATNPLAADPISRLAEGSGYEGSVLGASKNGVTFAYLSALIAAPLGLQAYTANSVVAFASALLLCLIMYHLFARDRLPQVWLVAAAISPAITYYGNQALKETFDVLLLVALVTLLQRAARLHYRDTRCIAQTLAVAAMLYFDREYYLYIAVAVWGAFSVLGIASSARRVGLAVTATAVLGYAVTARASYTFSPLEGYYAQYGTDGAGFASLSGLIVGLPRTLLAPLGAIGDPGQTVLLLLSTPVFGAYVMCLLLTLRERPQAGFVRTIGVRDPYLVTFFTMTVMWTITYGGGYERGRDAMAPFLFLGVARWQVASRKSLFSQTSGDGGDLRRAELRVGRGAGAGAAPGRRPPGWTNWKLSS